MNTEETSQRKQLDNLPPSHDQFWEGAELHHQDPIDIAICPTHRKDNWKHHKGYEWHPDGTITCMWCPWGTAVPSYYRVKNERIVDLRSATSRKADKTV